MNDSGEAIATPKSRRGVCWSGVIDTSLLNVGTDKHCGIAMWAKSSH